MRTLETRTFRLARSASAAGVPSSISTRRRGGESNGLDCTLGGGGGFVVKCPVVAVVSVPVELPLSADLPIAIGVENTVLLGGGGGGGSSAISIVIPMLLLLVLIAKF